MTTLRGNPCEFEGRAAARQGLSIAACPYEAESPQWRNWRLGYDAVAGAAPLSLPERPFNPIAADGREKRGFNDRKAWSAEEDAVLIALWTRSERIDVMEARLRRSALSIKGRAMELRRQGHDLPPRWSSAPTYLARHAGGIARDHRIAAKTGLSPKRAFTDEDDRRLLAMRDKSIPDWSIADKLAFPLWRVRERGEKLAAKRDREARGLAETVGTEWTAQDELQAWDLATRRKLHARDIAAELGRSEKAVAQKLCRLRGKFRGQVAGAKAVPTAPRPLPIHWTEDLDRDLARMWNAAKMNEHEIADALRTTRTAIMARKRVLRDRGVFLEERRGKLAPAVRKETAPEAVAA